MYVTVPTMPTASGPRWPVYQRMDGSAKGTQQTTCEIMMIVFGTLMYRYFYASVICQPRKKKIFHIGTYLPTRYCTSRYDKNVQNGDK